MTDAKDLMVREFDALARRAPDRILVCSPERSWTVGDVHALAAVAADRLGTDLGPVEPGHVVGLHMSNGPGFLATLVAIRRAGLVALLIGARSPRAEAEGTATRFGATALWSDKGEIARLPEPRPVPATDRPIGVIKLTSGSTGEPLGVATSTEALVADDAALRASMAIADDDRFLATIPFSHSYGLSSLVIPALVRGLPLLLVSDAVAFDPLDATEAWDPTVFPTVPAYLAAHLRRAAPRPLPSSLRLVVSAGAPLPPPVAARFREVHGQPVHVFYGASECGGISYDREGGAGERGTLGTPVEGVRVDLEPIGNSRRVVVSSAATAERYLPEADDRLGDGRYVTEDLAESSGGELRLTGRLGHRINVRGKKVDPLEIEAVLGRHAAVEDVRVIGLPREASGDETIRAVVVCRRIDVSPQELADWCRAHLADFKIPRSIRFVDRIPTDDRGKVDRRTLTRLAATAPRPPHGPER